jgi:hypothetical protein
MKVSPGNCPKCGKMITDVRVEAADLDTSTRSWKGINFCCPHCRAVLSAQAPKLALTSN